MWVIPLSFKNCPVLKACSCPFGARKGSLVRIKIKKRKKRKKRKEKKKEERGKRKEEAIGQEEGEEKEEIF